jgi:hypothetical protein
MSIADSVGNLGRTAYAIHEQTIAKKDERDQERMETLVKQLSATDKPLENMKELETFFNEAVREGILSPLENPSNWAKLQGHVGRMAGEEISRDILTDPDFNAQLNTLGLDGDASLLFREALTGRMSQVDESLHEDIMASQAVREAEARAVAQGRSVQADEMDRSLVREAKTALVAGDLEQAREILGGVRDATQRMPDVVKAAVGARVEEGDFSGAFELLESAKGLEVYGASYGEAAYAEHRTQLDGYIHRQREREAGANSARVQIASGQVDSFLRIQAVAQGVQVMDVAQTFEWSQETVEAIQAGQFDETLEQIATESGLTREEVQFKMVERVQAKAESRATRVVRTSQLDQAAKDKERAMQEEALETVANSVEHAILQGDFEGAREQLALALDDNELATEDRVKLMQLSGALENPGALALLESTQFSQRRAQTRDSFMAVRGREWWEGFSIDDRKTMIDQAGLGDFMKEPGFPSVQHLQRMGVPGWDAQEARIAAEFTELSYGFLGSLAEEGPPASPVERAKWLEASTDAHEAFVSRGWREQAAERQKKLEAEQARIPREPTLSERIAEALPENFDVQAAISNISVATGSSGDPQVPQFGYSSTPVFRARIQLSKDLAEAAASRLTGDPALTITWQQLPGALVVEQINQIHIDRVLSPGNMNAYGELVDGMANDPAFQELASFIVYRDQKYRGAQVQGDNDLLDTYREARSLFHPLSAEELLEGTDRFGVPLGDVDAMSAMIISPSAMARLSDPRAQRGEHRRIEEKANALGLSKNELISAQSVFYQSQGLMGEGPSLLEKLGGRKAVETFYQGIQPDESIRRSLSLPGNRVGALLSPSMAGRSLFRQIEESNQALAEAQRGDTKGRAQRTDVKAPWTSLPEALVLDHRLSVFSDMPKTVGNYNAVVDAVTSQGTLRDLASVVKGDRTTYRPGAMSRPMDIAADDSILDSYNEARSLFLPLTAREIRIGRDRFGVPLGDIDSKSSIVVSPADMVALVGSANLWEARAQRAANRRIALQADALGLTREELIANQIQFYQSQGFLTGSQQEITE